MRLFKRLIFIALIALTIFSFVKKRELPSEVNFPDSTQFDPIQTRTTRAPFLAATSEDGRNHQVTPLFNYEISGMVVSTRNSKYLSDYYRDKLNVLDVGILWGQNLNPDVYNRIKFYSNGVRLFWQSKDRDAFRNFNQNLVSNSHLICTDKDLIKRIKKLKRGDVVEIRGFLANYGGRNSSTVRTDRGDGACEVLWVEELTLLQDTTSLWQTAFKASLGSLSLWILLSFASFFCAPVKKLTTNERINLKDKLQPPTN